MILMYHKVFPEAKTKWWVEVGQFYRQMIELSDRRVVYLSDYDPTDENNVVITFDGVYRNVLEFAAPILKNLGYPFECFVTGDVIGQGNEFDKVEPTAQFASKEDLVRLVGMGARLQWHTRSHLNLKTLQEVKRIESEFAVPPELLALDAKGFQWLAYPHGEYNDTAISVASRIFQGALSCNQGNDFDKYCLNRVTATNKSLFSRSSIGVIIASFNYGSFLIEAIESTLRQTFLPTKILISDDGSNDNTFELATDYARRYPDLIAVNRNEINMGVVEHFNKVVNLIGTDFICILGADNRLASNYLAEAYRLLNSDSSLGVVYTDYHFFGKRARLRYGRVIPDWKGGEKGGFYRVRFPDFDEAANDLIQRKNFIHGSSVYRFRAYQQVGGYVHQSGTAEDHDLFRRIVTGGWKAVKASKTFLEYRQHSRSQVNELSISATELQYYKRKFRENKRALDEIRNSVSWRITRPLRAIRMLPHYGKGFVREVRNSGWFPTLRMLRQNIGRILRAC